MPELTKEQLYIILGIISVILVGCIIGVYKQNKGDKSSSPESSPAPVLIENTRKIEPMSSYVHISGAVIREGVYKLNKGDRLIDLIRIAGAASNANLDGINLAEPISDGQKVIIPGRSDQLTSDQAMAAPEIPENAEKIININTADSKKLDELPGIGPTTAKKIVDYRAEKGMFSNIEELKEVPGISEKKYDKLKKYISVN